MLKWIVSVVVVALGGGLAGAIYAIPQSLPPALDLLGRRFPLQCMDVLRERDPFASLTSFKSEVEQLSREDFVAWLDAEVAREYSALTRPLADLDLNLFDLAVRDGEMPRPRRFMAILTVTSNGGGRRHTCDYFSQNGQPPDMASGIRIDGITAGDWSTQQMKSLLQ